MISQTFAWGFRVSHTDFPIEGGQGGAIPPLEGSREFVCELRQINTVIKSRFKRIEKGLSIKDTH